MGVYAMPSDKPFKGKNIKTKRKRSRLDENAALLRDPNIRFEIKDGRLVVIKHDK